MGKKGNGIYVECAVCRRNFRPRKGERDKTCCSPECEEMRKQGVKPPALVCSVCAKPIPKSPYSSRQRTTCSAECMKKAKLVNHSGKRQAYLPTPEQIKAACVKIQDENYFKKLRDDPCMNNR